MAAYMAFFIFVVFFSLNCTVSSCWFRKLMDNCSSLGSGLGGGLFVLPPSGSLPFGRSSAVIVQLMLCWRMQDELFFMTCRVVAFERKFAAAQSPVWVFRDGCCVVWSFVSRSEVQGAEEQVHASTHGPHQRTPASSFHLTSHGSTAPSHDSGVLSADRICATDSQSPLGKSNFTPILVQSPQQ